MTYQWKSLNFIDIQVKFLQSLFNFQYLFWNLF